MCSHNCYLWGKPQSPLKLENENKKYGKEIEKLKEDTKYIDVHIRMNEKEKSIITRKAKQAGKSFSEYMRLCSMGCELREKPDKEFFDLVYKEMGKFLRTLSQTESLLYNKGFVDERALDNQYKEWSKFRQDIKERFL